MLVAPGLGAAPVNSPQETVQRVFPESTDWKIFRLSDVVQLQRCLMPGKSGMRLTCKRGRCGAGSSLLEQAQSRAEARQRRREAGFMPPY